MQGLLYHMTAYEWLLNCLKTQFRDNECWIWPFSSNQDGYGHLRIKNKLWRVSRLVMELEGHRLTEEIHILHSCDNPPCFNPEHLRCGSRSDNQRESVAKGRNKTPQVKGELNPRAKLSEDQVRLIRTLVADGEQQSSVARKFQVSTATICLIVNRKLWKEVE